MKHPVIAVLLLGGAVSMFTACGPSKKLCKEKTPASFATFLDEDWRAYCTEYRAHVEQPGRYELKELATFFGNHSARVKELNKDLYSHEKFETCFESPKEELELRELQTCLQDNDQTDIEIANAWGAVADPWVEDLQLRVAEISPRMGDAAREAKRQEKKVGEAFDFHNKLEGRDWESLQVELKSLDKAIAQVEGIDAQFNELVKAGEGHAALSRAMEGEYAPEINAIVAEVADLRQKHTELNEAARYLEFAWGAAGVVCPKTLKGANKELRTAKKVVASKNNEVGGGGPRITSKTRADSSGDTDFERFEGVVCGIRGPENQWEGYPQQCAEYRFVVERQKPAGERKWGDWAVKSFEETGSDGGVDCTLKKK